MKKNINIPLLYSIIILVLCILVFSLKVLTANIRFSHDSDLIGVLVSLTILIMVMFSIFYNGTSKANQTWKKSGLITLALSFCWVAETTKLVPYISTFSLAWFFGAHICLIIFCFKIRGFKKHDLFSGLLFLAIAICFYFTQWRKDYNTDQFLNILFKVGVPLYILLLTVSVWRASLLINSGQIVLMIAIIVFYISDLVVVATLSGGNDALDSIVWFTYLPTLFLISVSQSENFFGMFNKTKNG